MELKLKKEETEQLRLQVDVKKEETEQLKLQYEIDANRVKEYQHLNRTQQSVVIK